MGTWKGYPQVNSELAPKGVQLCTSAATAPGTVGVVDPEDRSPSDADTDAGGQ